MTISSTNRKAGPYAGNGVTTTFPFAFKVFAASDLYVVRADAMGIETVLALTTDYAVTLNADQNANPGGSVVPNTVLGTGLTLTLTSSLPYLQATDLTNAGGFYPKVINNALDRLTIFVQQLAGMLSRTLRFPLSDTGTGGELPTSAARANNLLGFDAAGNPIAVAPAAQSATALQLLLAAPNGVSMVGGAATAASVAAFGASDGAGLVGWLRGYTGAVVTTVKRWLDRQKISVFDFMTVAQIADALSGGPVLDHTAAIQAAINAVAAKGGFAAQVGAVFGGYISITDCLDFGNGSFRISATLACPSYFRATGQNATITQTNSSLDIFSCSTAYQWQIDGINFIGGRYQAYLENSNLDVTRWRFDNCTFILSSRFAIKTWPTGGATSHLSANLTVSHCAFYKPKQVLLNYCDSAIFEDCWVFISKDNFSAGTAAFENAGGSTDGHAVLYLHNMFGVPAVGTQGVDRLAGVRWIDNYGSLVARGSRFGGEFAGMAIVSHYRAPQSVSPFLGYGVSLRECWIFAGPSLASDSGVVLLQGQMPQRVDIVDCLGPASVPFIVNISGAIAAAYFTAYEAATSTKAYNKFQINIRGNATDNPDGAIYVNRIPAVLRPYVAGAKRTKVARVASQTLANAFAANYVSFDTLSYDNVGSWAAGTPTRLIMPWGASYARITVNVKITGPASACILKAQILNSAGTTSFGGQEFQSSIDADTTEFTFSADVDASASDYFLVNVSHNAAGTLTLASAIATVAPLDFIG